MQLNFKTVSYKVAVSAGFSHKSLSRFLISQRNSPWKLVLASQFHLIKARRLSQL